MTDSYRLGVMETLESTSDAFPHFYVWLQPQSDIYATLDARGKVVPRS